METEVEVCVTALPSFVKTAEKIWPNTPIAAIMRRVAHDYHRADHIVSGLYKVRVSLENTGKRGGARVIFFEETKDNEIILLTAYKKAKQENLSHIQLRELKNLTNLLISNQGTDYGRDYLQRFKVKPRRS